MADVYEQNLPQKTNLTTNDYVRVVGSDDVSYKQPLSDVAQKTIENYAGSTLAGSTQSVKGAIDGLKSSAIADKAELNASINEVASDLANESSTRASQDTNLQAQINQLVAPTGTAPNPAEIENARIGADNITYTTLGDAIRTQVTDLKSELTLNRESISEDVAIDATYSTTHYINTGVSVGSTVSLTPVSNSDWSYCILDVEAGDWFKIVGVGANAPRQWAFIDSDNKLLSVSAAGKSTESIVQAPKDGKLILNSYTTDSHSVKYTGYKGYALTVDNEITNLTNAVANNSDAIGSLDDAVFDSVLTPLAPATINVTANKYLYVNTWDYSVEERSLTGASTSDYLEVPADGVVVIKTTYGSAVCGVSYYDANRACIGVESALYGGASPVTVSNYLLADIPSSARYFRISSWYNDIAVSENVLTPKIDVIKPLIYGKTWLCVGDSLTAGPSSTKYYHDYISEKNAMTIVNMGRGGTGYMNDYENGYAFYQRIISQTSDIDFATVFGSGNDLNHFSVLGNYTDSTTDTICGCVNTFLNNYFTNYPTQPIGIISPTPWKDYPTTTPNNQMEQYVEKLRQIAEYRGVPFLDLYHHSNLRPENAVNREALFYHATLDGHGDGVHPNENGHKIIASKIEQFIKEIAPF